MFVFVLFEKNTENEVCVRERHFHWWARDREVAREPASGCRALLPCPMAHARRHARAAATAARTAKSFSALLAILRLLHSARQAVGTSRWWTLRWPNNTISLLGAACGLNTEGTYTLFREMRKVMLHHVRELWAVVMDRRYAADNKAKRAALKGEWPKLSRILANMRNRRGKLMPGWDTVRLKPI